MKPSLLRLLLPIATGISMAADAPSAAPAAKNKVAGTPDEPFLPEWSVMQAASALDKGAHLSESNCFACHSTFTHLAARSLIDPLADEVMKSRILLERFNRRMSDPDLAKQVKTHHAPRVRLLSAVELARHDAITTGRLSEMARQLLDHMWTYQNADGGVSWLHAREAPQAIDDYWPAAMMALGAGMAPDDYAATPKAAAGIERLRGWFKAHPPRTLHERGLILIAHSCIGGVLGDGERQSQVSAILERQHDDGGWSMTDLAPWTRKDNKPLNPELTDGYATGFLAFALARNGIPATHPGLRSAIRWLKTRQRLGGTWFTQSPYSRSAIATNSGTSLAVQALEACGELPRPKVTQAQFDAAHAAADHKVPPGIFLPDQDEEKNPPHP
jgi:squalene-hopene/tetraprenyl-beta-curcumene cyclase